MRIFKALVLFCALFAQDFKDLEQIQSAPRGIVRDFYIYEYIQAAKRNDPNLIEVYNLIYRKSHRIISALKQKLDSKMLPYEVFCSTLKFGELISKDATCIRNGLDLNNVLYGSASFDKRANEVAKILERGNKEDRKLARLAAVLSKNQSVSAKLHAILKMSANDVGLIYHGLDSKNRLFLFNLNLSKTDKKNLSYLISQNNVRLNRYINKIIIDRHYDKLASSLREMRISKASSDVFFALGLNEVLVGLDSKNQMDLKKINHKKAIDYFDRSYKSTKSSFLQARALFWGYLISGDKSRLVEVSGFTTPNIFSIYANELLDIKPNFYIKTTQDTSKYIIHDNTNFAISDPLAWRNYQTKIKSKEGFNIDEITNDFGHKSTLPHLTYALATKEDYKNNYFIFAYDDKDIWDGDGSKKALTYAVARQESNLLPAVISPSYALGMMQIMPFNVKPFAKKISVRDFSVRDASVYDMFNPYVALKFGNFYLGELGEKFKSPLFVSYAYNGGPGFLSRTLKKSNLFIKDRPLDPWLSMELIPYEETRFYGMKVMSNYMIYAKLLGVKLSLRQLLQDTLINKGVL